MHGFATLHPRAGDRHLDARGLSMSVFVCVAVIAILIAGGLAVDGAAQAHARRTCETAAAEVARIGTDATATGRIQKRNEAETGRRAALDAASRLYPQLQFQVDVTADNQLVVHASTTTDTYLLTLVGIRHLSASGSATAALR